MSFQSGYTKRVVIGIAVLALAAFGCNDDDGPGEGDDLEATGGAEEIDPAEQEPIPGVDLAGLSEREQAQFYGLMDDLSSPCGEAHSLRTSVHEDEDCDVSGYAARYVAQLVSDGARDIEVRDLYDERYRQDAATREFSLSDVPRKGPSDARVEIVEFIDYGCPACRTFGEVTDRAHEAWPNDVAVYYRFFPLPNNPTGEEAARAAVAAYRQGHFDEMHAALFENQRRHDEDSLRAYAEEIGLDMEQFEEDYEAAGELVERDRSRAREVGVRATPTVFINGREFTDPKRFEYVRLRIQEALALGN